MAAALGLPDAPDPEKLSREAAEASRAGNYATAEARYRVLAAAYPTLPSATIGLGQSLARLRRTAEAVEWLGKAADLGAGVDASALAGAFGGDAERPEVRALHSRFRGNVTPGRAQRGRLLSGGEGSHARERRARSG